jgi:hypothetical protein
LPDPEEEAIAHFARELGHAFDLIRELGGDSSDVDGELRQAVLLEAEGRLTETLALLRNAQVTATGRVSELFEHRLGEIEERQAALTAEGVSTELELDAVRLRAEFAESPVASVVEHLAEADRRLSRLELAWQELRNLLRQIDQVRIAALKLGHEFGGIDAELAQLKALVERGAGVTETDIDGGMDNATRLLRFYHEALSPNLQEELDRHSERLAQYSPEHPPSRRARQLHAEANRHLRNGRLAEAAFRLTELRAALEEVRATPVGDRFAAPGSAGAPVGEELTTLLARARELASRIKTIPPDTPIAEQAAAQIRTATELLRERRLAEAGSTLTELMRFLDETPAGGGGGARRATT